MKQRNLLLAITLLTVFALAGVCYFRAFTSAKPFGIIVFTGEGVVTGKLTAARLYDGGADRRLNIQSLPNLALITTHAAEFAVPDAAAAAGALACGIKLKHHTLGVAPDGSGRKLPNLCELARERGRNLGLVTNGRLTDPAVAAFYAHLADANDFDAVGSQLAERISGKFFDVILGGGSADLVPGSKRGLGHDERDLAQQMTASGDYTVLHNKADLLAVQAWRGPRLLGLMAADAFKFQDQLGAGDTRQPSLSEMVHQAIEVLQRKAGGYLLVVDAGTIARASQRNESEHVLQEFLELDRAVGVALQYAGTKTLVVVAGGESSGGMVLNGYPLRQDRGVALLGMNANGLPSTTWASGPNGPVTPSATPVAQTSEGTANPPANPAAAPPPVAEGISPAAYYAPSGANVAEDAIAAGFGPGSERLRGFQDNTFVFELLRDQL